uniref:Uncharacterized protein n=1 Tax=Arundo donax TaxID=35708 RepID=A0A0A9BJ89_ARUDO
MHPAFPSQHFQSLFLNFKTCKL